MPYKCLEPVVHDGRTFEVGTRIPDDMITEDQAKHLCKVGVLRKDAKEIMKKEVKAIDSKEVSTVKTPDLQSITAEDALNLINAEESLAVLLRWRIQEEKGKARKGILTAITRQIKSKD